MDDRKLTVYYSHGAFKKTTSQILLQGKWLEQAGSRGIMPVVENEFFIKSIPTGKLVRYNGIIVISGSEEEIMKVERCVKESFVVIGKEGSTLDGEGFIQRLWVEANSHFGEVQHLAKKDENGNIAGIWGAMSDLSHSFDPWEDLNKGLYLAGVECMDDAEAPNGWIKWIIPGYEYIYIECENDATFSETIKYLEDNAIPLVGAVHDHTCPQTGKNYMFFPIRKL